MFRDPQVNLYVDDVETSVVFYRDLFGFKETFRTPATGKPIHVELRLGGLVLGLASIESARKMHGIEVGIGQPKAEIALWTDGVDDRVSALAGMGVRILSPPHDFVGTLHAAWIADPDGNPIQLVENKTI
jgi:catechol 2,3-dioxygenase-like lactoylglutathione lyase family enzyme